MTVLLERPTNLADVGLKPLLAGPHATAATGFTDRGRQWGPQWRPPRVEIAGVQFDTMLEGEVVRHILGCAATGLGGWVVTPNVDQLRQMSRSEEIRALVADADIVVADGAPVEWTAWLTGQPLPGRVIGASLIWSLSRGAAEAGLRVFLLGGNPGVAVRAAASLQAQVPGLVVAGTNCPRFGFEDRPIEMAAIRRDLRRAAPDVVFVGLGFPKQERLIVSLRREFPEVWFLGVGAALSFCAGEVSRAPEWMQRSGLEWVHRLAKEPRRMFRRYVVEDAPFAAGMLTRGALEGLRGS